MGDKGGLEEIGLDHLLEEVGQHPSMGCPFLQFEAKGSGRPNGRGRIGHDGGVEFSKFQEGIPETDLAPGRGEIDLFSLVGEVESAVDLLDHGREKLLRHRHQLFIGRIALIEFEHGKFGIVEGRDPFVSETAVDFEDPFEPTDHQPFKIELRGHPQVKI